MTDLNPDFREDELQLETEEDIGNLDQKAFASAVVSGNDWTAETLINQINKGNIALDPNFQRRDAWDKKRKSKFIESLILGLPIPQVVLAESKERRGSYIVLDGKQRLLSIRQFAAEANDPNYEQLKLTSLEIREDLKGQSLESMRNDLALYDDLSAFENQPIRTVVIKNWPNEEFLYHVFLRLNTGSVPLSPQELRQALNPGEFSEFLDFASTNSVALKEILKSNTPDFRMRDAELLLRYLSFRNYLSNYSGSLKKFLDESSKSLNDDWVNLEQKIKKQLTDFESAHIFVKSIFKGNEYKKWNGEGYESRFNRAIFDIMVLSFDSEDVRNAAKGNEKNIEEAFQRLCRDNPEFLASIEVTTKSLTATQTRISMWFNALNGTIGSNLYVPQLVNNRIV